MVNGSSSPRTGGLPGRTRANSEEVGCSQRGHAPKNRTTRPVVTRVKEGFQSGSVTSAHGGSTAIVVSYQALPDGSTGCPVTGSWLAAVLGRATCSDYTSRTTNPCTRGIGSSPTST